MVRAVQRMGVAAVPKHPGSAGAHNAVLPPPASRFYVGSLMCAWNPAGAHWGLLLYGAHWLRG